MVRTIVMWSVSDASNDIPANSIISWYFNGGNLKNGPTAGWSNIQR